MSTDKDTIQIEGLYTGQDAVKAVKRVYRGRVTTFYIRVSNDMPIVDADKRPTDRVFPGALYSSVELSRPQALKYVQRLAESMAGLEERGGRIPVTVTHRDWGEHWGKKRYRTTVTIG